MCTAGHLSLRLRAGRSFRGPFKVTSFSQAAYEEWSKPPNLSRAKWAHILSFLEASSCEVVFTLVIMWNSEHNVIPKWNLVSLNFPSLLCKGLDLSVLYSSWDSDKITSLADSVGTVHIQSMGTVPPCQLRAFCFLSSPGGQTASCPLDSSSWLQLNPVLWGKNTGWMIDQFMEKAINFVQDREILCKMFLDTPNTVSFERSIGVEWVEFQEKRLKFVPGTNISLARNWVQDKLKGEGGAW